jgi:hypothetical protein
MRESVVKPLPFLRSIVGGCPAGQSVFLLALRKIAAAGDAHGLGRSPKSFLWRKDMDKDKGLAILSNPEVVQDAMRGLSQTRALTLQIHEALVKARVPGYLEAY